MTPKLPMSPLLLGPLLAVGAGMLLLMTVGKVPVNYNVRNLVVRWRTTLLTALAFTLVVALMSVMLAFVNGLYALTLNSAIPGNIIIFSDGALDETMSNLGNASGTSPVFLLSQEERAAVACDAQGMPLASLEAYMVAAQPIPVPEGGQRKRRFLQLRGLSEPATVAKVHNLALQSSGAWFSQAGVEPIRTEDGEGFELAVQAVIGEGIAREMGKDRYKRPLKPGDFFELGPRRWIVTGILNSAGTTFDSEIWAKMQVIGPMFGKDNWTTCVVRVKDPSLTKELAAELTKNVKSPAILAQPEADYYDKLNATNWQFLIAIGVVTAIMAVGSVFGVMNTMFAAIAQRTKDIGVMRILGFSHWQILVSFFLESLVIALIGGALGSALGYLANGLTASSVVSGGGGGKSVVLKLVVDANIIGGGLLFALVMGAVGGLLPALSAMRLRPLESLR